MNGSLSQRLASINRWADRVNALTEEMTTHVPRTLTELRANLEHQRDILLELLDHTRSCDECGRTAYDCTKRALDRGIERSVSAARAAGWPE